MNSVTETGKSNLGARVVSAIALMCDYDHAFLLSLSPLMT
jgi:hypothetical protein